MDFAVNEFEKKYFAPGENWDMLADRVGGLMQYSHERDEASEVIRKKEFLPNTPCLVNAHREGGRSLVACNILKIDDSIYDIFKTNLYCALLFKAGAGVGLQLSDLSPAGTRLKYMGGMASGVVSFLHNYDMTGYTVSQGGALRRAAMMGVLSILHDEAEEYMSCKRTDGVLTNFNLSVSVPEGPTSCPSGRWDKIIENAWFNGTPGVIFLDNINADNPTLEDFGSIDTVNACSEYPGYEWASCVLGSVVLPNVITRLGDWKRLEEIFRLTVRFLDRVIDVNHYPLPQIATAARKYRDIGVGVMGWRTLLGREGIPFLSEDAFNLIKEIGQVYVRATEDESEKLAEIKGGYLPGRKRNRVLRSIAPTGHIRRLAGVSSSIYPNYAFQMNMGVDDHVKFLRAWYDHVDSAISYTASFPNCTGTEFVDRLFREAHSNGIKVISTYRDGSRKGQPCKADGTCSL